MLSDQELGEVQALIGDYFRLRQRIAGARATSGVEIADLRKAQHAVMAKLRAHGVEVFCEKER